MSFLEKCKINVPFWKIKGDLERIQINSDRSDIISYPEFIKYFEKRERISKHDMIIGIHFSYGWMPTIFDFRSFELDQATALLNKVYTGIMLSADELSSLKRCFNNSLVGASKLLHFVNPKDYAIWDSRVYRYLTGEKPYQYRLDVFQNYLDYLEFCKFITNNKNYESIHYEVQKKLGFEYEITPLRSLELIMFENGGNKKIK